MEVFEAYKGMYNFKHLPLYAKFLLQNHLAELGRDMVGIGQKLNLPVLDILLLRFSEEQLISISTASFKDFLQSLVDNKSYEEVSGRMSRWLKDELEVVGKIDISGKDLTLATHVRGQVMKKFVPLYTKDIQTILDINSEIDLLLLGYTTTALDSYIDILKKTISEQSNLATKVIEASPAVTFLFDAVNKKQIFTSGNVIEVMGYTPEEISGFGDSLLTQLTHPHDVGHLMEHIQKIIRENSNETHQVEYRVKHKNGEYRWLRTYEVIFKRDEAGKPLEILGKTFEINHEKETALALEKREQQLLEAQSIAHIGSYEWNIRTNTSTNTEELIRIMEMNKEQRYEEFMSFVHPGDEKKVKDALTSAFISGRYECEFRYVRNGREKVLWSLGKVEFKDGVPYSMIGTVQDITEFKKLERELTNKSQELAASNESLRQFAYVASHDMKEPLRKIMMFSELLIATEKNKVSEKSLTQLQKVQSSSKSLYRMIEDILSFSLLEGKEDKQVVKLESLIKEVNERLEETIRDKNAEITYNNLPEAEVISSQFRQLFQNLISNSLKFSRRDEPPRISISGSITPRPTFEPATASNKYLELKVQDNGIGFPDEVKERIFDLFNRHHSKAQYEGTGLGLSITRRIVENHHGTIRAFPGKDKGATFVVVIPQGVG